MGQSMRQIGIVIGLTLILTFPVTVVSGAGSQKRSDHALSSTAAGAQGQSQGMMTRKKLGHHELRLSGIEDPMTSQR
jgi:hypothetical protein